MPANVTTSTRVIGLVIPNNNSEVAKADDWKPCRVSVRGYALPFTFYGPPDGEGVDVDRADALHARVCELARHKCHERSEPFGHRALRGCVVRLHLRRSSEKRLQLDAP